MAGFSGLDAGVIIEPLESAARALARLDEALRSEPDLSLFLPNFALHDACGFMHLAGARVLPEDLLLFEQKAGRPDDQARFATAQAVHELMTRWSRSAAACLSPDAVEGLFDLVMPSWRTVSGSSPALRRRNSVLAEIDATLAAGDDPSPPPAGQSPADLSAWCRALPGRTGLMGVLMALEDLKTASWLALDRRWLLPLLGPRLLRAAGLLPVPLPMIASGVRKARNRFGTAVPEGRSEVLAWELGAIALAADEARCRLRMLRAARAEWLLRIGAKRQTSRLPAAIDALLQEPVQSTKRLAHHLRMTQFSAIRCAERLVAKGILQEVTGRRSFRYFAAPALLQG